MTGQDFQDRLDALVQDLQTKGKGQTVQVLFRGEENSPVIMPLSSDGNGVVNAAQLAAIQQYINYLKPTANDYETYSAPVAAASEAFKTAQEPHVALMTAATNARKTLNDALEADANYQSAKTALDTARSNPAYISAREVYLRTNISENYAELQAAKGKYTA